VPESNHAIIQRVFSFDPEAEADFIAEQIRESLRSRLRKRGVVVAISGGVDSSVSCALSVRALGREKVLGLSLPERDSSPTSLERSTRLARALGIRHEVVDVTPTLESIGCYRWRDDAIREVFPEYGEGWKNKIAISGGRRGQLNHFNLIVRDPEGATREARLRLNQYLQIVAATNFKQRVRKTLEFAHADRLNYAVVGTPNRLEHDQGFFVKNGDGSADLKPIAHLYKVQVYMLARHLGLPAGIRDALPTTDTYSLAQGQDEFYFALPYAEMDLALWHLNAGRPAAELAAALGIGEQEAEWIYADIRNKRRTTAPLHGTGVLLRPVAEVGADGS
jgi:NAD+ synthase